MFQKANRTFKKTKKKSHLTGICILPLAANLMVFLINIYAYLANVLRNKGNNFLNLYDCPQELMSLV